MICVVLVSYSFYWIVVIELINFINLFCRIVTVNCVVVLYHMKGNFILHWYTLLMCVSDWENLVLPFMLISGRILDFSSF